MNERVGAIIIKDRKLLLVNGKGAEHYWTPGGKVEEGESPEQALKRELREELGINLEESKLYAAYDQLIDSKHKSIYYIVVCKGTLVPGREIMKYKWCSSEDIKNKKVKIHPFPLRTVIKKLFKEGLL